VTQAPVNRYDALGESHIRPAVIVGIDGSQSAIYAAKWGRPT